MLSFIHTILTSISRKLTFLPRGFIGVLLNKILVTNPNSQIISFKANNGLTYITDLRSYTENYICWTGEYEGKTMDMVLEMVDFSKNILDIGGNVGYWTINMASKIKKDKKVFTFEPVKSNYNRILEHLKVNNLEQEAKVFNTGLGDIESTVYYDISDEDDENKAQTFNATIVSNPKNKLDENSFEVKKLDNILESEKIMDIGFIKIDVEGYEANVFRGANKFLQQNRPLIYGEFTPEALVSNNSSMEEIFEIFSDYIFFQEEGKFFIELKEAKFHRDILLVPKEKLANYKKFKQIVFNN
jgi:FkbM family methyltransferase